MRITNVRMMEFVTNVAMDQSWMNACHVSEDYEKVVIKFFKYAQEHIRLVNKTYYYPCVHCLNQII